jgi:uncharacterized protein YjeT (DUF2065 family)
VRYLAHSHFFAGGFVRVFGLLLLVVGAMVLATGYWGQSIPFLPQSDLWIVGASAMGLGAAVLLFMRSDG